MAAAHELETGRDWVKVARAAELVQRSRMTVYRWVEANYVREQAFLGKAFVSLTDALETEAALSAGRTPTVRTRSNE